MVFACWKILCQLAPWLLLGMLLSGLLHAFVPPGFIRRKFHGSIGVVKAVLFGIPLPLCSCGVVPAGIGLKNQGASSGSAIGFLISTPQTGVDSILVSTSFFGWPFAIFKMVTAGILGVAGGWITSWAQDDKQNSSQSETLGSPQTDKPQQTALQRIWEHAWEIIHSIWGWLLVGIVVSAVIETYIPPQWFEAAGQWGSMPAMILVLVLATPLYVCATASVPIAAALVSGGMPPAAALVFLMAGPATNGTTIGAIYGRFGGKTLTIYLTTIIAGSMFFAMLFDWLLIGQVENGSVHVHEHNTWWALASAVLILVMLSRLAWIDFSRFYRGRFAKDNNADRISVSIDGLKCGSCVNRVESVIKNHPDVDSVTVDLKSGAATIIGKPTYDEIEALVESAGFGITPKSTAG